MLVEAFVFDRDDRLLHDWRDIVRADEDAALGAAQRGENGVPVVRVDVTVDLALNVAGITGRNLTRDRGDEPEGKGCQAEQNEEQEEGCEAELADPPTVTVGGGHAGATSAAKQAPDSSSDARS